MASEIGSGARLAIARDHEQFGIVDDHLGPGDSVVVKTAPPAAARLEGGGAC